MITIQFHTTNKLFSLKLSLPTLLTIKEHVGLRYFEEIIKTDVNEICQKYYDKMSISKLMNFKHLQLEIYVEIK